MIIVVYITPIYSCTKMQLTESGALLYISCHCKTSPLSSIIVIRGKSHSRALPSPPFPSPHVLCSTLCGVEANVVVLNSVDPRLLRTNRGLFQFGGGRTSVLDPAEKLTALPRLPASGEVKPVHVSTDFDSMGPFSKGTAVTPLQELYIFYKH